MQSHGGRFPENFVETVKQTGCVIIRGVVSEEQASSWESELRSYTKKHPNIAGFPKHDPQNFSLFWTRPQVQIRSHPNVMKAMHAVSQLWSLSRDDDLFDLSSQVVYADRFRIRHPSKGLFLLPRSWGRPEDLDENVLANKKIPDGEYTLKAHQDSGAMERWEDPQYRACYQKIFEGKWEDYDPWCADHRSEAKTDLYSTGSECL